MVGDFLTFNKLNAYFLIEWLNLEPWFERKELVSRDLKFDSWFRQFLDILAIVKD